jgi:hypothetical protein
MAAVSMCTVAMAIQYGGIGVKRYLLPDMIRTHTLLLNKHANTLNNSEEQHNLITNAASTSTTEPALTIKNNEMEIERENTTANVSDALERYRTWCSYTRDENCKKSWWCKARDRFENTFLLLKFDVACSICDRLWCDTQLRRVIFCKFVYFFFFGKHKH